MREVKDPSYIKEIAQIMNEQGLTRVVIGAEVILERGAASKLNI